MCLKEIEQGADVDTVLFRHPERADELRPILEASVKAKAMAAPAPSQEVLRRNRAETAPARLGIARTESRPGSAPHLVGPAAARAGYLHGNRHAVRERHGTGARLVCHPARRQPVPRQTDVGESVAVPCLRCAKTRSA
ncbi:MAG: hypothetical protein MZV64_17885 [Ignavibacteriales bacterium]|nr:hypothetical protein [Ignavibacteriales bacterium]